MSNVVKSILLILFISLGSSVYAQDTAATADTTLPQNGVYTTHHTNGKVKVTGNYKNGEKHGLWKEFDSEGRLKKATKYKKGKMRSEILYDEDGKMIQFTNRKGKVKKIKDCNCSERAN